MNSFEEIIEFAIRHEESEAAFYERMAARAENNDVRNAMLHHAKEELEHKAHLEKIMTNHHLPDGKRRYPDPDMKIADYSAVDMDKVDLDNVSYQDALLLAAKQELAAQKLYQDLADRANDAELKKVFEFLAEQEGKHRNQLEQEYDDNIMTEN